MYRSLDTGLIFLTDEIKQAEQNIFDGKEKEMVIVLSKINRELLDYTWSLHPHEEVLRLLESAGGDFFGKNFIIYLKRVTNIERRIFSNLDNLREMFNDLRLTNDSLLTIKTNEIMKILTIMAFVTFPLSVITSTFGMNTEFTPILGQPFDFWIVVAIMLALVAFMFAFFRYKRWL
jgi:magnesium transporter